MEANRQFYFAVSLKPVSIFYGWPQTDLEARSRSRNFCTSWESNPGFPARGLVTVLIELIQLHGALKLNTNIFDRFHWWILQLSRPHPETPAWVSCYCSIAGVIEWPPPCLCVCTVWSRRTALSPEMPRLHIVGQRTGGAVAVTDSGFCRIKRDTRFVYERFHFIPVR